jgi:hypothetical protein
VIKIQKNSAYTQVLEILNYIRIEDYYKVPKELICALEANKDNETNFKYNKEKDFLDQNVSQEAKLILAVFFKRYWATDGQKEKIRIYEINKLSEIEEEKKKIYPQNIISDKIVEEKIEERKRNQLAVIENKSWYKRLWTKIKSMFTVGQ